MWFRFLKEGNKRLAICENITGKLDTTENVNSLNLIPWNKALDIVIERRDELDNEIRYLSGILSLMKKNKY